MKNKSSRITRLAAIAGLGVTLCAYADVTVQQKTSLDVASVIHVHGATTSSFATEKKREDSESHCEGMMSLLCGNVQSGEIVRLDRDVTWHLEPAKKRYREQVFATPEETAAMRAAMEARLEKMRSCPVQQQQQPVDQSKCQMSPPKIDVHKTDDKMAIAGHDARRTAATLTETCTNKDTGDVCDTVIAVDVWLTQDTLPGSTDRRAFNEAYARKLGLTDTQGIMQGEAARYLAPYQAQIKQLTDKSGEFKGQPLKTSLRVLMGGQQCSAAAKMKSDPAASGDGATASSSAGNPLANAAQMGKAIGSSVGNMMGGLFHKKPASDTGTAGSGTDATPGATAATPTAATPAGAPVPATAATAPGAAVTAGTGAAPPATPAAAADPFAHYVQMAAFSTETVTISTEPIPSERFDIPPDWTKETPKPTKSGSEEFTCPKT